MKREFVEGFLKLYNTGLAVLGELEGSAAHHALDVARAELRTALRWAGDHIKDAQTHLEDTDPNKNEKAGTGVGVVAKTLAVTLALLGSLLLFSSALSPRLAAQVISQVPQQNNALPSSTANVSAGVITNPSGLNVAVSPGPVYCNGSNSVIHSTQFTLTASTGPWFIFFRCPADQLAASLSPPSSADILLGTVTCGATTCATLTDLRSVVFFPNENDETFFVPASSCSGAITGTAGSGNATDILAGSGGVRVFRLSNTAAGASNNTFTCVFTVPSKLTAGKGFTITDATFLVSTQTTQPTSIPTPTFKSITVPAAVDPETANSATFVAAGSTITIAPTSAQFAAYTAVAAGQFFSVKVNMATPVLCNTDLQLFQLIIQFNQSAAAAGVQETPGFFVHGKRVAI